MQYCFPKFSFPVKHLHFFLTADYNWLHKGHIGTAPKSAFRKKSPVHRHTEWAQYVRARLAAWRALHGAWLARARFPHALLVVRYERLVRDTRRTLRAVLRFLNLTATEEDMNCTLANREGIYRRKKKYDDFDPFTRGMYRRLAAAQREVLDIVTARERALNGTDEPSPSPSPSPSLPPD